MAAIGDIRIGISGWTYAPWRGAFYPKGLRQADELAFASKAFGSIEINGTFYGLQTPKAFARWRDATPEDFVFSVKGSRYITHRLRAKKAEPALAKFFASGVLELGPKLGPLLWQFPPNFRFEPERMEAFFAALPRDTAEASRKRKRGDTRPLRHAVEIRHESFACPEFIALLRKNGIGLVVADTVEWPLLMDVTADFVYCRLHGSEELYASGYGAKAIRDWAGRVITWAKGGEVAGGTHASPKPARKRARRDVFVYFDNDAKLRAPADAKSLRRAVDRRL